MKKIVLIVFVFLLVLGGVMFYIFSQPSKDSLSKEFKEEAIRLVESGGRTASEVAKNLDTWEPRSESEDTQWGTNSFSWLPVTTREFSLRPSFLIDRCVRSRSLL